MIVECGINPTWETIKFDALELHISNEDWTFLCECRLFSSNPAIEDIQSEFVTGTGITQNKKELWPRADELSAEYISDLREIRNM